MLKIWHFYLNVFNMHKVTVCIPIFNEEQNIHPLFEDILDSELYLNVDEIIFIDDKSTDSSLLKIKKISKIHNKVRVISLLKNKGQSYCLYTAVKNSKNDVIASMDGDCQNPPSELLKLINIYFDENNIKNQIKLVAGIRKKRQDSIGKIYASFLANKIRQIILKDNCSDTGCSLKVFDKKIFLKNNFFDGIHRFIPALFEGRNYNASYVNVDHKKRKYGKTKYNNISRLIWGIRDILKVKKILKND